MTAMVTGHRPNKLFGYDMSDPRYTKIQLAVKEILRAEGASELWTGMALGSDMLAALAAIGLQDEGHAIKLNAAIPFRGHKDPRWPGETQALYDAILSRCARTELVSDAGYSKGALKRRDRYMLDRSDLIIAIYAGKPGGTADCVKLARRMGKAIWFVDPANPSDPAYAPAPAK